MPKHLKVKSYVPWWLEDSDLNEANDGEPELTRDCCHDGVMERHYGLTVKGQYNTGIIGMIAIRTTRTVGEIDGLKKWQTIPMGIAIPETPLVIHQRKASMDITLLSGPQRHDDNDGA